MRFWFGRKSAPDTRPFVPAWLTTAAGEGFARSVEGMTFFVRANQAEAAYSAGTWQIGLVRATALHIDGEQVVGARQGAVAEPTGGAQIDSEARLAINAMLAAMRAHGLIEQ